MFVVKNATKCKTHNNKAILSSHLTCNILPPIYFLARVQMHDTRNSVKNAEINFLKQLG